MTKNVAVEEKIGWNIDNSYTRLPEIFYSTLNPAPVPAPHLVVFNDALAKELGLNIEELKKPSSVRFFTGNKVPKNAHPVAQAYAGHQFGHFTMLGDGRAVLIGEQITPTGRRLDFQLKGSGPTQYSRGGDGKATLGPMLREYIISEAMYGLGIPTSRSLAVVYTGEKIWRERPLPGAILTRIASSHIRVGTFQYAANWGTSEDVKFLADNSIQRHFPHIEKENNKYLALLNQVVRRQAMLIAKWQLVGFIHGVMNTDNMAISGETIDYGPCAFMDQYDPGTVFSSIDANGRYAYENQPTIGAWNLARFAETLLPLLHDKESKSVELAETAINEFFQLYNSNWLDGMRGKLGLLSSVEEDKILISRLLDLMHHHKADFTNTFRTLTMGKTQSSEMELFSTDEYIRWHKRWQVRLKLDQDMETSKKLMKMSNPAVIPRNHRVEEALEAAVEDQDYSVMQIFLTALQKPYNYDHQQDEYARLPKPSQIPYQTYCGT